MKLQITNNNFNIKFPVHLPSICLFYFSFSVLWCKQSRSFIAHHGVIFKNLITALPEIETRFVFNSDCCAVIHVAFKPVRLHQNKSIDSFDGLTAAALGWFVLYFLLFSSIKGGKKDSGQQSFYLHVSLTWNAREQYSEMQYNSNNGCRPAATPPNLNSKNLIRNIAV